MRIGLICALALLGAACGSGPAGAPQAPPPKPVKDLTGLLPLTNRVAARVVPDHLLENLKLPGGSVGDYKAGAKEYQMFVIEGESFQAAAFMLVDAKEGLQNQEYIAYMGGYFGTYRDKPLFVYAKRQYLAGVYGLPRDQADALARVLALRLK